MTTIIKEYNAKELIKELLIYVGEIRVTEGVLNRFYLEASTSEGTVIFNYNSSEEKHMVEFEGLENKELIYYISVESLPNDPETQIYTIINQVLNVAFPYIGDNYIKVNTIRRQSKCSADNVYFQYVLETLAGRFDNFSLNTMSGHGVLTWGEEGERKKDIVNDISEELTNFTEGRLIELRIMEDSPVNYLMALNEHNEHETRNIRNIGFSTLQEFQVAFTKLTIVKNVYNQFKTKYQ